MLQPPERQRTGKLHCTAASFSTPFVPQNALGIFILSCAESVKGHGRKTTPEEEEASDRIGSSPPSYPGVRGIRRPHRGELRKSVSRTSGCSSRSRTPICNAIAHARRGTPPKRGHILRNTWRRRPRFATRKNMTNSCRSRRLLARFVD